MNLHEILKKVAATSTKAEKVKELQANNSLGLRDILKGGFDDTVIWDLPPGVPSFTTNTSDQGFTPTSLNRVTHKLRFCVKGHPAGAPLTPVVKERMLLEILEGIPRDEADLVVAMKEKKLTKLYPGLTKDVVISAFPALLAAGQNPEPAPAGPKPPKPPKPPKVTKDTPPEEDVTLTPKT